MKTLLIILTSLILSSTAFGQTTTDPQQELLNKFSKGFTLPDELRNTSFSENALVEMMIQPDGKVRVIQIETNNTTLQKLIESRFNSITLPENAVGETVTYSVNLLFKVL